MQHPTVVHRRAIALVRHYRARDMKAVATLLAELAEPEDAGAALSALVQLCSRVLDERPTNPTAWLQGAALRLALAEGGDVA